MPGQSVNLQDVSLIGMRCYPILLKEDVSKWTKNANIFMQ